ncbi:hypothetical protein Tco_1204337 [Tanacetum coccineum]
MKKMNAKPGHFDPQTLLCQAEMPLFLPQKDLSGDQANGFCNEIASQASKSAHTLGGSIDTSSASNAIFEINKLRDQLQGKDTTIRNLNAQFNIMKVLNAGSTEENVSLKRRYDELSKANTHSRTAYTEKINALTAENAKLKTELSGKKSGGSTASEKPKVLASGMGKGGDRRGGGVGCKQNSKYIPPPKRANWVKPTPLPKKKQVTFQEPPRTSNRPTQKPPVQQNKKPNIPVNQSTRTKPATESRKPMPKYHTRNHHILPSRSVNARRAADHNRKLHVVDHNQFVVRSLKSVNTKTPQAKHSVNHTKKVWKATRNHNVNTTKTAWRPTRKVVGSVKPQWKPTGRYFALYDNCPLTRIMEPIVEPLELTPSVSSSSKVTMISRSKGHTVADSIGERLKQPTAYNFKTDCMILRNAEERDVVPPGVDWVGGLIDSDRWVKGCERWINPKVNLDGAQFPWDIGLLLAGHPKKQKSTCHLTTGEAVYIALSGCCAQIYRCVSSSRDMDVSQQKFRCIVTIKGAICSNACNSVQHSRSKHIDIRHTSAKSRFESASPLYSHCLELNKMSPVTLGRNYRMRSKGRTVADSIAERLTRPRRLQIQDRFAVSFRLGILKDYLKRSRSKVIFGDDSSRDTEGYSSVNCNGITFTRVAYVNSLKHNLISISQLCDANFKICHLSTRKVIPVFLPKPFQGVTGLGNKSTASLNINKTSNNLLLKHNLVSGLPSLTGRSPDISYFYVFGCLVHIHNHRDHLGKFDKKADDGFFLGYSPVAKAFRVFNIRRQEMEEIVHVTFSEDDE